MSEEQVGEAMQMIMLQDSAIAVASEQGDVFPPSIGHIALSDWSDISVTVKPGSWPYKEPDGYENWPKDRQIQWINTHTDYAYFLSGVAITRSADDILELDDDYVSFMQIPQSKNDDWVIFCFMDRHYQVWSYDKADRHITKQTGHTIAEWIGAKSPGSGQINLP